MHSMADVFIALLFVFLFHGLGFAEGVQADMALDGLDVFDSDSIAHDGPAQWRWLSVPGSRAVLNPSLITERSTPLCPALAMHVGYYHGPRPRRMQQLAAIRVRADASAQSPDTAWRVNLAPGVDWAADDGGGWSFHGVARDTTGEGGVVTVLDGGDPWGWASYPVTLPADARSGFLRVDVPWADGAWALKIGHHSFDADLYVQHDTRETGVFRYDLSQVDGWRGLDAVELKFFAVGNQASARLARLDLELRAEDPAHGLATTVESVWHPYQLAFTAHYDDGLATVEGRDFFYDEHTLVRLLDVCAQGDQPVTLSFEGRPYGRRGHVSKDEGVVVYEGDYAYALRFLRKTDNGNFAPAPLVLDENDFQWRAALPIAPGNTRLALVVSFASEANPAARARQRALQAKAFDARLVERKAEWDRWLASVPAPTHFGVDGVAARGVTADAHRRAYYGAWTFVLQNVLPPMPENGYPHAQTPTGKPSLWAEGSSKATASAAWESFFAQQLLVFVMPDVAWDAFEGIMMQVDADGWLDGEVLPSRKAQTAWILYAHTGDRDRLARVYPPIGRYLRWREKNPRWIYKDHDNPWQRDSNFVDSLLLDLAFAERIAEALDEDPAPWRAMTARVTKDYLRWFFPEDQPHPVQYYYTDSKKHDAGHATWVCSGLYLDGLPQAADDALLGLFRSMYDPDRDLAGLDFCKYPIASMIVHGLRGKTLVDEAEGYMLAVLRDVIRAGRFSENYSFDPLRSWGVEDSIFGAAILIEFTLLRNGVRIDQGLPEPLAPSRFVYTPA